MAAALAAAADADRRALLTGRIRLFITAAISYNVIEAVVAITAGNVASSTALIGFGLDSIIEVTSAAAVAWQFAGKDPQAREQTALRVIAWSFLVFAAYVGIDAVIALAGGNEARHSTVGLILAAVSLVLMPLLSYGQRRTGRQLNSRSAVPDSRQTLLCTYLSAVLLVGLAVSSSWAVTPTSNQSAEPRSKCGTPTNPPNEASKAWNGCDSSATTSQPESAPSALNSAQIRPLPAGPTTLPEPSDLLDVNGHATREGRVVKLDLWRNGVLGDVETTTPVMRIPGSISARKLSELLL